MKLELQYFQGCPGAEATIGNLRILVQEKFISADQLKLVEVPDLDRARELHFQGSPTLLCNGVDIYTDQTPRGYNYSCRIYSIADKKSGVLGLDFLRQQIGAYKESDK